MVKQHFENTINQLKSEKERQLSVIKERVTREQIIPHNNEVNQSRDKAIAELSAKLNSDISNLQEKYAIEKQSLIEVGERNKADFANAAIATETAIVAKKYDDAVADIEALIAKIKE